MPPFVKTRRVIDAKALYREIGKRIRAVREQAGLSQGELGVALGMTRANVSMLEQGSQRVLVEHVYNVALLVGQSAKDLLP
jgi:transcriptional regulator with XRE-family HTH domain